MVAVFLAGASCAREGDAHRLRPTETIVGRAALGTETVLLTDRPALVHVDRDSGRQRIVPIRSERAPTEFWGLAENDAALYTVARFDTLLRIEPDGAVVDVAALDHSVSNLIDLVDGVAGQRASGTAGEPLLVRVDPDGSTRPLPGPTRRDLGLSPPEALLLQLLRCSAPPRVLCWSAVSGGLLEIESDAAIRTIALDGMAWPSAQDLAAALSRLSLVDAIEDERGGLVVLYEDDGDAGQRVIRFSPIGVQEQTVPTRNLRLLIKSDRSILALDRDGIPVRVSWP